MTVVASVQFSIAPGRTQEAMEYLHKVADHIKGLTGLEYRLYTQMTGPTGRVMIVASHDNVAAWDAARSKVAADAAWQKMAADAGKAGLFIAGSIESALWQQS